MTAVHASRNIRLTLAYDGTQYCGWQVQANGPSIQAELERAIHTLTGEHCPVYSAGRTDSGVHALAQVANFHTRFPIPAANFRPALQSKLPRDIVLLESAEVPSAFHATFSAKRKQYRYVIDNSEIPLPFLSRYAWQLRRPLSAEAMHTAAQSLVGTHDFRSFETDWPNKATSVRTVEHICVGRAPLWELWCSSPLQGGVGGVVHQGDERPASNLERPTSDEMRQAAGGCPLISIEIVADGFLYNMVRSIVGTLVNVGRGKWAIDDVSRILLEQRREVAGATAPACGLYLVRAEYA